MELVDLVLDHEPSDDVEATHLGAIKGLLVLSCTTAQSRKHYDPGHITASAFVLSPDRQAVALIHHAKLGIWVQPGGHMEPDDEDVEEAALREIEEEVGLTDLQPLGLLDVDVHEIPARGDEPAHQHHDLRFGFVASTTELVAGDGVNEARWVPLDAVGDLDPDEGLRRAVAKLRRLA